MKASLEISSKLSTKIAELIPLLSLISLSSIFVICGNLISSNNLIYAGIIVAFVSFVIKYLQNLREYVIVLFFNLCLFIFFLGRYLVREINGIPMDVSPEYTAVSLNLVFISLITVNIVYLFAKEQTSRQWISEKIVKKGPHLDRFSMLITIGLLVSAACAAIKGFATFIYSVQYGYTSLYLSPDLPIPAYISVIGDMLPFFVALCLARMPDKKVSYTILLLYSTLQLPLLLTGKRMPMIIAVLVWVSYVALRHYRTPSVEQWIGKGEKIAIAIAIPIFIVLVPLIGDIRSGSNSEVQASPIERLLDGQGVTLDVVSHGVRLQDETPPSIYGSYTFAPLLDYISTNFVSRALFNTQEVQRQTEKSAMLGTNYADTISYLVLWNNLYFSGQGLGSSYVIETYIDFGVIGLVIYSIALALLIRWMTDNFGRSYFRTFLIILLMMSIYSLPRDTSLGFIVSILQIHVIILIAGVYLYDKFMRDVARGTV